jgi:formate-dependent nitrite reductase membrane component NrfD
MDDPTSEISRTLAREKVTVRKPEQGTAPKLFYIEGSSVNLHPTATAQGDTFMWADALNHGTIGSGFAESQSQCGSSNSKCGSPQKTSLGVELRAPQTQGDPTHGAIDIGGTRAEQMVQVGYNAQHKVPWHWPVPAYLVTKGLAAGIFLLVALAQLLGGFSLTPLAGSLFSVSTVFLLGLTTVLLVFDLEKPGRFLYILTRPQWRSWLTRGAFFLIGFSLVASLWAAAELLTYLNWLDMTFLGSSREGLFLVGIPLAVMAAIYTAFLFGQAEGRDFWQSPLLPVHLLIQALLMGCAAVLLISGSDLISPELTSLARWTFAFLILLDAFAVLSGEFAMPHASDSAAKAAHAISHGKYKWHFWVGSLAIGHLIPFLFVALTFAPTTAVVAALCSIVGLYSYEYAFVMAPQEVPNS